MKNGICGWNRGPQSGDLNKVDKRQTPSLLGEEKKEKPM